MAKYAHPRDQYIQSRQKLSLDELAKLWAGRGHKIGTLKAACAKERWRDQRAEFQTKYQQTLNDQAAEKTAAKMAPMRLAPTKSKRRIAVFSDKSAPAITAPRRAR